MTSTLLDITYGKGRARAVNRRVYGAFPCGWAEFVEIRVTMWFMFAP